jgi:FixJ family two-component response regulator
MEKAANKPGKIPRAFSWLLPTRKDQVTEEAPRIVAIVREGRDSALLAALSRQSGWALTLSETPETITSGVPPVILYDRALAPSNWSEVIGAWTVKPHRPYVILLSPKTDANLWEELQRAGGSDILRLPLNRDHVLKAVKRAWKVWCSQQHVRSPLRVATIKRPGAKRTNRGRDGQD